MSPLEQFVANIRVFYIGPFEFHLYGLIIGLAICCGLLVFWKYGPKQVTESASFPVAVVTTILLGIVFGRLFFVVSRVEFFLSDPATILRVWDGGITIFGVIFGGLVGILFWWKIEYKGKGTHLIQIIDSAALAVPLAQAVGRWANFVNQELFGLPCDLLWKIYIQAENRPIAMIGYNYFHPTFLYESILNIINFTVLLLLFLKRETHKQGITTALFLINYGIIRIMMERLRVDSAPVLGSLKLADIASLMLVLFGVIMLVISFRKSRCAPKKPRR